MSSRLRFNLVRPPLAASMGKLSPEVGDTASNGYYSQPQHPAGALVLASIMCGHGPEVKGTIRWTRARPRSSNNRARFSEQVISGRWMLVDNKNGLQCLLRPYGPCDVGPAPRLPSGMSATGSTLAEAMQTFGALSFARMIRTFQGPGPSRSGS